MTTRIVRTKGILHGQARIDGTRISTEAIYELALAGHTATQIVEQYPILTRVQIDAACKYERSPRRRIGRRVDVLKMRLASWLYSDWMG